MTLSDHPRYPDRACRTVPTWVFYPEQSAGTSRALKVCDGCPIQAECLDDALATPEWEDRQGGIRGGTTPNERRRMRTRRSPRSPRARRETAGA